MHEVHNGLHNILLRRIECNVSDVDLAPWRRYVLLAHCIDSGFAGDVVLYRRVDPIQRRAWLILYVSTHSSVVAQAPGTLGLVVINQGLS